MKEDLTSKLTVLPTYGFRVVLGELLGIAGDLSSSRTLGLTIVLHLISPPSKENLGKVGHVFSFFNC